MGSRNMEELSRELEDFRSLKRNAGWERLTRMILNERDRVVSQMAHAAEPNALVRAGGQLYTLDLIVNMVENRVEILSEILNRTSKE